MAKSNPEIRKRPLNSTPNSCSAGLAGVTRHHATPEPKLHKRATRRRKASAVFCGVGRSINLDLDLDLAGVDKENHLNQTSQKERSGQPAVAKPELFLSLKSKV